MRRDLSSIPLYHITSIDNLPAILATGGLLSDIALGQAPHQVIGYANIKQRRMTVYRVPCCDNAFVGDFVPFYYCPRSQMLYTINVGRTGKPPGYQREIVHLVTSVEAAIRVGRQWAISDGNAGAEAALFYDSIDALDQLDWPAIRSKYWNDKGHQKAAEFLVRDFYPWAAIAEIGCQNEETAKA